MNTYRTSDGERVTKAHIDRRVKEAKFGKLKQQIDEHGYNFCERTGLSSGQYLDCSHIISVDQCQKMGRSEIAWDPDNIEILCREEHNKVERMSNNERQEMYERKKEQVNGS